MRRSNQINRAEAMRTFNYSVTPDPAGRGISGLPPDVQSFDMAALDALIRECESEQMSAKGRCPVCFVETERGGSCQVCEEASGRFRVRCCRLCHAAIESGSYCADCRHAKKMERQRVYRMTHPRSTRFAYKTLVRRKQR